MHPELAKAVHDLVGRGFVVEDAARSRAVLLHANQVNHVAHAILSLLTLGLWLLVWFVLVVRGAKPVRLVLDVDTVSGHVRRLLTAT